jgi:hypothetical protein
MSGKFITQTMGFGALAAAVLLNSAPAPAADAKAAGSCDRACLQKSLDGFLSAVFKHDPGAVPLSGDYFATENTMPVAKGEGAWKSVTGYSDLQRRYFDPVNQTAAFFGILKKDGHDQITSVRIKVANGAISEAEWIFGTQGPGGRGEANPAGLRKYPPPPPGKLPAAERSSRFQMITLPNDYFQAVVEHDGSWVPNSADCIRIENGGGTTANSQSAAVKAADQKPADASGMPVPQRGGCLDHFERFKGLTKDLALRRIPVVDEEAGVALGSAIYVRNPTNPAQDNLVHEYFFIRNGKISGLWTSMYFLPKGSPVTSGWEDR